MTGRRVMTKPRALSLVLGLLATVGVGALRPARATVYFARDEALEMAFPKGTTVERRTVFLTEAQLAEVKGRTGDEPASKMFSYYRGVAPDGAVVGYAVVDSRVVRTMSEALLIVLAPNGEVQRVVLLAFHEPPEYGPSEKWLSQFGGRRATGDAWRVGHDVHGIAGATLTAHAARDAVSQVVVLHQLVMAPEEVALGR
jgi:Na+-translocating ferredoxin:NAD+ oxidoreductase RnfG subunit